MWPLRLVLIIAITSFGFESFENFDIDVNIDHPGSKHYGEGNIDFAILGPVLSGPVPNVAKLTTEKYNILGAFNDAESRILTDKPYVGYDPMPTNVHLQLKDENGIDINVTADITASSSFDPATFNLETPISGLLTYFDIDVNSICGLISNENYTGTLVIQSCHVFTPGGAAGTSRSGSGPDNSEETTDYSHAGRKSLWVKDDDEFEQQNLQLIEDVGQTYPLCPKCLGTPRR